MRFGDESGVDTFRKKFCRGVRIVHKVRLVSESRLRFTWCVYERPFWIERVFNCVEYLHFLFFLFSGYQFLVRLSILFCE